MIEHYVSGASGEASEVVSNRTGYSQDLIDAVVIAALLKVEGDVAVRRHCDAQAIQMAHERRYASQEEFAEWLRGRAA